MRSRASSVSCAASTRPVGSEFWRKEPSPSCARPWPGFAGSRPSWSGTNRGRSSSVTSAGAASASSPPRNFPGSINKSCGSCPRLESSPPCRALPLQQRPLAGLRAGAFRPESSPPGPGQGRPWAPATSPHGLPTRHRSPATRLCRPLPLRNPCSSPFADGKETGLVSPPLPDDPPQPCRPPGAGGRGHRPPVGPPTGLRCLREPPSSARKTQLLSLFHFKRTVEWSVRQRHRFSFSGGDGRRARGCSRGPARTHDPVTCPGRRHADEPVRFPRRGGARPGGGHDLGEASIRQFLEKLESGAVALERVLPIYTNADLWALDELSRQAAALRLQPSRYDLPAATSGGPKP